MPKWEAAVHEPRQMVGLQDPHKIQVLRAPSPGGRSISLTLAVASVTQRQLVVP